MSTPPTPQTVVPAVTPDTSLRLGATKRQRREGNDEVGIPSAVVRCC